MIYTAMTKKAMRLIYEKHAGQVDKAGIPYVFHPFSVAESMNDEITATVALLHDIVEDTDMDFVDLLNIGFPQEVVDPLRLLTHDDDIDYFSYIRRIATNDIATKVKLSDLKQNMNLDRLDNVNSWDKERLEKYKLAAQYLEEISNDKENGINSSLGNTNCETFAPKR